MTHSSVIYALQELMHASNTQLRALEQSDALKPMSLREIEIINGEQTLRIIVSDEFGDANLKSQTILLHLVLSSCEYYEDAVNYSEWLSDIELPKDSFSEQLYQNLSSIVPEIRDIFGTETRAVSDYDMQFNTNIAKELRSLSH